jgi:hypothetical protein
MGLEASVLITDWDAVTVNGSYRAGAGAVGSPLAGNAFIGHHHSGGDATTAWQIATSLSSGRTWNRTRVAGVWGGWTEVWTVAGATLIAGTTGRMVLPNGYIQQWGRKTFPIGSTTANADVVFPLAFPNACFSVVASIGVNNQDYDIDPGGPLDYRASKQSVSIGVPFASGVEIQVFMDTIPNNVRVMQWVAIGN